MDYTKEDDGIIFYLRFLQAAMVAENISEFLKEAEDLGIDYTCLPLLEMLDDLLGYFLEGYCLQPSIHKNILTFVFACRNCDVEESKEDRKERISLCNMIVSKLNQSQGKQEYPFYPNLIDRFYPKSFQRWWNHLIYEGDPSYMQEILNSYLSLEYYTLYSHSDVIDEEEFLQYWCTFLVNTTYLEMIDILLNELPELQKDPVFMKRLRRIIEENDKLFKEYKGKPDPTSLAELDSDDMEIIKDRHFRRMQRKIKSKIKKIEKDS